ncbi:MAG TPA: YeeE/YedE family protein [Arenibaculum sp.]|nr:YeeE/YedE family protein [Arenibaculum sp.]
MTDLSLGRQTGLPEFLRGTNPRVVLVALLLLVGGALWLADAVTWRQAALYLVGGAFGVALYHAAFGFSSAFRVFVADRRGAGLRAHMVMLGVACALFLPALAQGSVFGQPLMAYVFPIGLPVVMGAFLFGVGMQLGGGCASGTLYTVAGGSARMVVTLLGFIAGFVLALFHLPWWMQLPALPPVSLAGLMGWLPALMLLIAVFAAIAGLSVVLEKRRHGRLLDTGGEQAGLSRLLRGPWPLVWGAVALAVLNFATLLLAGRPWGVTSAFGLWGSKTLIAMGYDGVAQWPAWQAPPMAKLLSGSIIQDVTTVMDFGIIVGALLAAGLAGKFAPVWNLPWRTAVASITGGLLMGYGARIGFGCNIGAYFSGIASGSIHAWVWLAFCLVGTWVGIRIRPLFGLLVERTPRLGGC